MFIGLRFNNNHVHCETVKVRHIVKIYVILTLFLFLDIHILLFDNLY